MTSIGGGTVINKITSKNIGFGLLTLLLLLIAHAAIYLAHEYSHSLMAWSLGWMARPVGIDYGRPTLGNFLFLGDVGDGVDYAPIFASGHGVAAAIIALSGTVLGNGLLYFVIYGLTKWASAGMSRVGVSFAYWLSLMCAANVWGYVPLRAITTHADIALAAKGLHFSTWTLFPFLAVPALYTVYHFFRRMFPLCQEKIAADSGNDFIFLSVLTAYWFFSFFSGDGIDGSYGLVSQVLCIMSRYVFVPFCTMYLVSRYYPRSVQSSHE